MLRSGGDGAGRLSAENEAGQRRERRVALGADVSFVQETAGRGGQAHREREQAGLILALCVRLTSLVARLGVAHTGPSGAWRGGAVWGGGVTGLRVH
jgi:hypothetical protein